MEYLKATERDSEQIFMLVQDTIRTVYPKYYPKEVVDFFCELHGRERITEDIKNGFVGVLRNGAVLVGTGSYQENHITRVYVKAECQGSGYGSYIMQCLENEIGIGYDTVYLDASLPACRFYEKRGYQTLEHRRRKVENGRILAYEVMAKSLPGASTAVCYDGRVFIPQKTTENGEANGNTSFAYHQKDRLLWAEYAGGGIVKGNLVGTVAENGELDFYYLHINEREQVRVGICHSVPRILDNGKIELSKRWQWLNGDRSEGVSVLAERE